MHYEIRKSKYKVKGLEYFILKDLFAPPMADSIMSFTKEELRKLYKDIKNLLEKII